MIGLNLRSQYKSYMNAVQGMDLDTLAFLGTSVFDALRSPDLSVPALLKEDNWVEFHSSFQQFVYEYLFRQQEIQASGKPKVAFFHLTQEEETCRKNLEKCIDESFWMAQEIIENEERSIFFRLRWYSCDKINFMYVKIAYL